MRTRHKQKACFVHANCQPGDQELRGHSQSTCAGLAPPACASVLGLSGFGLKYSQVVQRAEEMVVTI
jgi:hypothetical protein